MMRSLLARKPTQGPGQPPYLASSAHSLQSACSVPEGREEQVCWAHLVEMREF